MKNGCPIFRFFTVSVVLLAVVLESSFCMAQRDKVYKSLSDVRNLDSVYVLKMNYRRLKTIPPKVFEMRNLRILDLGCNFIDSIPPGIERLANLEVLDMRRNRIRTIPAQIGQLRKLKRLNMSRNPILDLPDEMSALENMEELVLWCTGVVSFPPSFVALNYTLKLIDLRVCPLTWDDQQAIEQLLPTPRKRWDYVCNCK